MDAPVITTKNLIEKNIWEVIGLDISEEAQSEQLTQFAEAAWLLLIDQKLPKVIGQGEYKSLCESFNSKSVSIDQFVQQIQDIYAANGADINKDYDEAMEEVLQMFVEDQITFLEKRIKAIKDETERGVKLSLINNLKELFTSKQWDQMGEIFKKIEGYQLPESLVLHL